MNYIIHPITNENIDLNTKAAKDLIRSYILNYQNGGAGTEGGASESSLPHVSLGNNQGQFWELVATTTTGTTTTATTVTTHCSLW